MKVVNVRINGMENPVGFDFETVCVSWKVRETSARRQQNVKIEIALTEDFSELLWTKEGKNLNSAAEKLEFEQSAYTRYYVRVTVIGDIAWVFTNTDDAEGRIYSFSLKLCYVCFDFLV